MSSSFSSQPQQHLMTEEEDDWDKIELNLEALTVTEEKLLPNKPVILARPSPPWPTASSTATSSATASNIPPPPIPTRTEDEVIDDALITALENPREKMILLQIEDSILRFVKSNEKSMDLPTGLNGFRRLLSYRVAQRFNLNHVTADVYGENGEKAITLFKTPETSIPKVLLIDLKHSTDSNGDSEGRSGGSSSPTVPSTTNEPPKKMLVMKRNPNPVANTSTKSNSSSKQQLSAEEREKAYNEARARIFGESAAEGVANTESSESAKTEPAETLSSKSAISKSPSPPPPNSANLLPKIQSSGSLEGGNNPVESVVRQTNSSSDLQVLDGEEQDSSKSSEGRSKKQIDPSSWKGTRGQFRNLEAEKNDPDFARRSNAAPRRNNRNNNGGNYSNSGRDNYRGDRGDRGGQPSYYGNNASYNNNSQQYNPYMYGMSQATNSMPTAPGIMGQQSNPYYSPYNMDAPFLPPPPPPTLVTPQAPPFAMPPAYDPRNMYPNNNGRGSAYGDEYSRSNQSPRLNSNANASLNKTDFPPLS